MPDQPREQTDEQTAAQTDDETAERTGGQPADAVPTHYDLVIIGTGSGNSLLTPDFEHQRVAIIESGAFGGTCLNVGCIPTKMFVYAADAAEQTRRSSRVGVDASVDAVRWADIRDRIFGRIDPISAAGERYREHGSNTTVYRGRGRFTGPRRLAVALEDGTEAHLSADQVVIATGSHPVVPDEITASGVPFHTSDTIMRIDAVPQHLLVLGGGFIACEMAHVFDALGAKVSVLTRGEYLLSHHDETVRERFTTLAATSWDVHRNAKVTGAREVDGGIELVLDDGTSVRGDMLLVATGRTPSTADLDLAAGGVEQREDGRVRVDDAGHTSQEGVWALGDVSSDHQLKHVANHEARVVAHNLVHPQDLRHFSDLGPVPSAVFSSPQVASVGLTEQECREQGLRYVTKVQAYADIAYGWAMEDTTSFCKLIADPATGLLLGAHIMGAQASSLIQTAVHAMSFGQRVDEVARGQYWIHPALAEVVENALLGLELD